MPVRLARLVYDVDPRPRPRQPILDLGKHVDVDYWKNVLDIKKIHDVKTKTKTRLVVIGTIGVPLSQPCPPPPHVLGAAPGHGGPLLAHLHDLGG